MPYGALLLALKTAYLIVSVSRIEVIVHWEGKEGRVARIGYAHREETPFW
jgi:hypothetical protein